MKTKGRRQKVSEKGNGQIGGTCEGCEGRMTKGRIEKKGKYKEGKQREAM